jgi:cobalt/nickel transport system permease protein
MELDRHIPRDSPVHRFDARLKLLLAVAAILGIALLPSGSFVALAVAWLATVAASALARLGPWRLVKGSIIVLPFAIVALPLIFTRPGEPLLAFDLGPLGLTATQEGLRDAASIVVKSWISVQVALLLAYTTPFPTLIEALRSLRLPAVMVNTISFMYRYLAVIGDEAERMNRARAARSASGPGRGGSITWRARVTGAMVGSLFIRSYERSERVYAAMLSRGFDGTMRGPTPTRPSPSQLTACGIALAGIVAFTATVVSLGSSP